MRGVLLGKTLVKPRYSVEITFSTVEGITSTKDTTTNYTFKRVGRGLWECTSHNPDDVPEEIIDQLGE